MNKRAWRKRANRFKEIAQESEFAKASAIGQREVALDDLSAAEEQIDKLTADLTEAVTERNQLRGEAERLRGALDEVRALLLVGKRGFYCGYVHDALQKIDATLNPSPTEPTPPTFKVGDRVKWEISGRSYDGTIEKNLCEVRTSPISTWQVPTDSLTLIEPPTEEQKPRRNQEETLCSTCVQKYDCIFLLRGYPYVELNDKCDAYKCNCIIEPPTEEPKPTPKLRVVDNRLMYGDVEVKEYVHEEWESSTWKEPLRYFEHMKNPPMNETHYIIVNGQRIKVEPSMWETGVE